MDALIYMFISSLPQRVREWEGEIVLNNSQKEATSLLRPAADRICCVWQVSTNNDYAGPNNVDFDMSSDVSHLCIARPRVHISSSPNRPFCCVCL